MPLPQSPKRQAPHAHFDDAGRQTSRDFRHSPLIDTAHTECDPSDDSESDDSLFHWDEEATLLSDLMDEEPRQSDDQHLDALADSLQTHFTDHGKVIKKEIVKVLVPTHNHVKNVFRILDKNVDTYYGQGAATFNKACKEIEEVAYNQQNDLKNAHHTIKVKVEKMLEELRIEYATRDKLWTKLRESVNEIVTQSVSVVEDTPARIERTIAKTEKRAKDLEAKDASSVKDLKGIQDLLETK
ncbi:hypothetical protein CPB84DRAFT_1841761 [Gymnopilus junonius]|uniref:Uncharacterized protein n=1 Tax=Gymnopilus junonius TaxID=109634 RepID=A0A9P5TTV8_GYMJU|nr:hypothetical protein CPB84DRAFT_1841761 [Gymnopilus junonius]